MRLLAFILISTTAFTQTPLSGINSTAAELPAGARDVVASIKVDPTPSGGDLLTVMLAADSIRIRIELPDGRLITKESASSAGFTWEVAVQGQGDDLLLPGFQGKVNHLVFLPPKAPAGDYRVHADASALKGDSALILEFLPLGSAAASAAGQRDTVKVAITSTEVFHYAGEKVQLVAGVFDGDRGINNARLSAQAIAVDKSGMPLGQPMPVEFRSSGPGADGAYNAELPTSAEGKYEVALKVQGKYADGTEFERIAATSITIEPRRAQLLGVIERPIDEDGNGLIDRIDVTARVKVELPGDYSLIVDLNASDGHYMQANGKAELGVGEGTITARFERFNLTHVGADGPYKISARLFRKEGQEQAFASLLENAGVTRDYKQLLFDRGPIYFAGNARAAPKSETGKRPFNQLVVSLDVFTPGGACRWYGGLRSDRTDIDFVNNSGQLPRGAAQVTLVFGSHKISDAADGKPLDIGDAGIDCGALHAALEKRITLPMFTAGTFVKEAPAFDLFLTQQNVPMERGKLATLFLEIRPQGGFDEALDLVIDGLPDGIVAQNFPSSTPARRIGALMYQLLATPNTPLGHYRITIRAKYKTMERAKTFTIVLDQ